MNRKQQFKSTTLGISEWVMLDTETTSVKFINPYWQILENSSKNFSEISVFRGVTQTDFWKTHPVLFRNFNFRGMSWTDFWKIHASFFCKNLFSFCTISAYISGHDQYRFLENSSIFDIILLAAMLNQDATVQQ